jgi:Homeodomain-like domain-containing protein
MEDKARLLGELARAGRRRKAAQTALRNANERARRLAPQARDAGASVQEIADALGVARTSVYALMDGGEDV